MKLVEIFEKMRRAEFLSCYGCKEFSPSVISLIKGVFCSGFGYYLPGVVMKTKGLVFVTTFGPLCLIIVAIMSYFFLEEKMLLGRVIGAVVICLGLFMVVWGKNRDQENNQVEEDVERG